MKIENIKFKAKRIDGKGWAIGDLLHSYENGAIIMARFKGREATIKKMGNVPI